MEINKYLETMKVFQAKILELFNDDIDILFVEQILMQNFENKKIEYIRQEMKPILYIISKISNNYHRSSDFFNKIEKLLFFMKDQIKKSFSNFEIFQIFKSNKRILLYLFKEKFIIPDQKIVKIFTEEKYQKNGYLNFFYDEIKFHLKDEISQKIEKENRLIESDSALFEEKRKNGENENCICKMIQNDLIDDFISYVSLNNISLSTKINKSIFETNNFLQNKNPTFFEYSAFYGSIQIFKYLLINKQKVTSSLWTYAVHGKNSEIIHLLEENNNLKNTKSLYENCLFEAIKCHHNEIADYFLSNFIEDQKIYEFKIFLKCIKYYNFEFPTCFFINEFTFDDLCRYDHLTAVKLLLKTQDIKINANSIQNQLFFE